ncbi:MAG: hypothetical protein WA902_11580 [Thermosynechococcaceae cyanobacterium]
MILTLEERIERDLEIQARENMPDDPEPHAQLYEENHRGQRCRGVNFHDCDWAYTDADYDEF